ncbi:glycerate kinase [Thalassotalea ponticola]|uniref:glycerate kinase n=1 Tax=Thalassotalea ponticola TaxID=1523392 RepID=UPI0025B55B3E|nr:glycerate kinase [Thalassotalea ponticola]MDN3652985.1 glycerate kinase [Thalassotalea ponticola]
MKIVIAPDSFKESLSAIEVCEAISQGMRSVLTEAEFTLLPMADGGEGSTDILLRATNGQRRHRRVRDPLGRLVTAYYGLIDQGKTAIVEVAQASGLHLLAADERQAKHTCSFGTGELIKDAIEQGARHIILCLGGSATNDAGAGLLRALGLDLLDRHGQPVKPGGIHLDQVAQIDDRALQRTLAQVTITLACDVDNPMCGRLGASRVFGPQKGATSADIEMLDRALQHFATSLENKYQRPIVDIPGSGAAGGIAGALMAVSKAQIKPGIEVIIEATAVANQLSDAQLVITGEGRIDGQTIHGKTPVGIAKLAKQYQLPCIAVCGSIGANYERVFAHGIDAVFSIMTTPQSLDQALQDAEQNLIQCSRNIAKTLTLLDQ